MYNELNACNYYSRFQMPFHCNIPNFAAKFGNSLRSSKFISVFTSRFVNKGCNWSLNSTKPIKYLVYKPACEFWNELLNFATNFRTSQRSSEYYSEKLSEIDSNSYTHLAHYASSRHFIFKEKFKQTKISQVKRKEMKNCKRSCYAVLKDLSN